MKLDKILAKLDPKLAARLAGYGISTAQGWYMEGVYRTVPNLRILVSWANHLGLSDLELGVLIRDSDLVRMECLKIHHKRRGEKAWGTKRKQLARVELKKAAIAHKRHREREDERVYLEEELKKREEELAYSRRIEELRKKHESLLKGD